MAESDRRRGYQYNRVLIETERILDPAFDDAVVFLSGAQIEMLRNITQYLNRRDTYVSEQFLGYYLTPTIEDYDSILEIVADMEETLMGNPNVIWGYEDRWSEFKEYTMTEDASHNLYADIVPAGYVYTLQAMSCRNRDSAVVNLIYAEDGVNFYPLVDTEQFNAGNYRIIDNLNYILKEGDRIYARFISCNDEDRLEFRLWGYKTVVPAE